MEGVLNIDKPGGMTSHDVVNRVRRVAGVRRIGHAGTLDPLATGVLVIGVGRATRLLEYVVGQSKCYWVNVRLGQTTTTYDAEGDVVQVRPVDVTRAQLSAELDTFLGAIDQIPPMFSALKQAGRPLYALARAGIEVERAPRRVFIESLELGEWRDDEAALTLVCSSGTYVRTLVQAWGEALGCGAHVIGLRRLWVGEFSAESALPLDQLTPDTLRQQLLPLDAAVQHLPRLDLDAAAAQALRQGRPVERLTEHPFGELARVYAPPADFVGLVTAADALWLPEKIFLPVEN